MPSTRHVPEAGFNVLQIQRRQSSLQLRAGFASLLDKFLNRGFDLLNGKRNFRQDAAMPLPPAFISEACGRFIGTKSRGAGPPVQILEMAS